MSTALSTTVAKQLEARKKDMAARLAGLGGDGGNMQFLRAKAGKFRFPDDEIVKGEVTAVIIDWAYHYGYWDSVYDPSNHEPPVCVAVGQNAATLKPAASSPKRQNDDCATCPMNQFGSGGGNRKACKNTVNLALIRYDDEIEDDTIYFLSIPPASLRNFKQYASKVAETGRDLAEVVTVISFDDAVDYVKFKFTADARMTKDYTEEDDDGSSYLAGYLTKMPEATDLLLREPSFESSDES